MSLLKMVIQKRIKLYCIIVINTLLYVNCNYAQTFSLDSIITEEKLREVVCQIADDSLQGRYTNSIGCTKAANIIAERMESIGLKRVKGMNGYFNNLDKNYALVTNVIGAVQGGSKKDENIIISAHYDHLESIKESKKTLGKDRIFNGANDDASGIAVMLAIANYFATKPNERTILFIAFSGEEEGMVGSWGLSEILIPKMVVAQINLEMLGRIGEYKNPFITGDEYSNLRNLMNEAVADSAGVNDYFKKDEINGHNLFMRSDNLPFALHRIPAHTIMLSTDNDVFYHNVKDAPETLDYKNMCAITKNIILAIEPLVQGKVTPKRIDPYKIQGINPAFLKRLAF